MSSASDLKSKFEAKAQGQAPAAKQPAAPAATAPAFKIPAFGGVIKTGGPSGTSIPVRPESVTNT